MVRDLIHDPLLLGKQSLPATREDLPDAQDLLDTLMAHRETCVGMAGNMIGVYKRIIAIDNSGSYLVMLNPEILRGEDPYETKESCLSLLGDPRPTTRYRKIKVRYQNLQMQVRLQTFRDFPAQIIQHEVDHCGGVLI